MHVSRLRMASLWLLDLEVVAGLLHLWLSLITFMVVQLVDLRANIIPFVVGGFVTFEVKSS